MGDHDRTRPSAERSDHLRETSSQCGRDALERLVEEGRLDKLAGAGRARGYCLPGRGTPLTMVPVLGRVPAGPVDLAVEDLEGYVPVAGHDDDELFGLRVRGESMRDLGILDGDLAIVRKQSTARSGEVVVALIGEEATVKTLFRKGRRIELHPANRAYKPIVPDDPHEFSLLGKVIEIRRTL